MSYTVPFGQVASITTVRSEDRGAERFAVVLRNGEELQLEPGGDLSPKNAGLLIFVEGRESPEYLPWVDVDRIDLDPPLELGAARDER